MFKQYFTLLLLFFLLQISSSAQFVAGDTLVLQTKISINRSRATLYEILNEIEENYKINFSYANNLISLDATRSINFKEQTLEKVLNEIFKRSTITYKVIGKRVVLIKEDLTNNLVTSASLVVPVDTNSFRIGSNTIGSVKNKNVKERNIGSSSNIKGFRSTVRKTSKEEFSAGLKFIKYKFKRTRDSTLTSDSLSPVNNKPVTKQPLYFPKMNNWDKYSLAINFMVGPSLRKLYSDNPEGKGIISQRGQENRLTGINAEIILNYHFTPSFSIGQGAGFLKMGEQGSLWYREKDKDFWKADMFQDSIGYKDSTYYYDHYDYSNNFSYLTLPIVIGYACHWKNFFMLVHTGIKPSLLLSKGKELEYYNYAYYFDYENSSSWRRRDMAAPEKIAYRKFNLAYSFQAEVGYRFKDISVSTGLGYSRFLFSTYKNSAPLKEKRSLPGIVLALKYNF